MKNNEKFWDRVSGKPTAPKEITNPSSVLTLKYAKEHLQEGHKVLDFGCGSGTLTNELAGHVSEIDAIDISSGMINNAIANSNLRGITNVKFQKADIFSHELNASTYDVVLAFNVLHHISEDQKVIDRIFEVLKPNGLFLSATPCIGQKRSAQRGMLSFMQFLRIVPSMSYFSDSELQAFIEANNKFQIERTEELSELPERFIVAKKAN